MVGHQAKYCASRGEARQVGITRRSWGSRPARAGRRESPGEREMEHVGGYTIRATTSRRVTGSEQAGQAVDGGQGTFGHHFAPSAPPPRQPPTRWPEPPPHSGTSPAALQWRGKPCKDSEPSQFILPASQGDQLYLIPQFSRGARRTLHDLHPEPPPGRRKWPGRTRPCGLKPGGRRRDSRSSGTLRNRSVDAEGARVRGRMVGGFFPLPCHRSTGRRLPASGCVRPVYSRAAWSRGVTALCLFLLAWAREGVRATVVGLESKGEVILEHLPGDWEGAGRRTGRWRPACVGFA